MQTERIADTKMQLAELMLSLTREQIASSDGRTRLAAALRNTLDAVELLDGVGPRGLCGDCLLQRPGVGRAVRNLAGLLSDAQEHVDFLDTLTERPRTPA